MGLIFRYTTAKFLLLGTCFISIEAAGPSIEAATAMRSPPPALLIVPREFRGMAGWVNEKCVTESGGIGGFVTHSLINLIEYTVRPGMSPTGRYRKKAPLLVALLSCLSISSFRSYPPETCSDCNDNTKSI